MRLAWERLKPAEMVPQLPSSVDATRSQKPLSCSERPFSPTSNTTSKGSSLATVFFYYTPKAQEKPLENEFPETLSSV